MQREERPFFGGHRKMRLKAISGTTLTLLLTGMFTFSLFSLVLPELTYASPYTDIGVDTAYNMITNGSYPDLVVLDVRRQDEYDSGHIFGAVWIPHTELESRIDELVGHEDHEIIVYCAAGFRSQIASEILDSYNFTKVYNMVGGISAWQSAGYPIWIATVHNVDTTFNYDTIQAAIDAPQTLDGNTVRVDAGTYVENVEVTKSLFIFGKDGPTATTVIAKAAGPVFDVMADYVSIMNFSVTNGTELPTNDYGAGIYLREATHCNISNNIIYENYGITAPTLGIHLSVSHFNEIVNNTIRNNNGHGICLFEEDAPFPSPLGKYGSHNNSIRKNIIFGNKDGIYILGSYNNLTDNILYSNEQAGISFQDSVHCRIEKNNVTSNSGEGITLTHCHNFIVRKNEISMSGSWCGLRLGSSSNNTVSGNKLKQNIGSGISIDTFYVLNGTGVPSLNNEICENALIMNDYGIKIGGLHEPHTDNAIYHNNFINNTVGQAVDPWSNLWDDGYPSGGNYWSDHNPKDEKSGPNQDVEGQDNIGDTSCVIVKNNEDRYPLIYPYGWVPSPDINNDGFVDIYDIVLVSMAFGSYPGHPYWNPVSDVIGPDAVIDIFDAVLVAKYFGSAQPPSTS